MLALRAAQYGDPIKVARPEQLTKGEPCPTEVMVKTGAGIALCMPMLSESGR